MSDIRLSSHLCCDKSTSIIITDQVKNIPFSPYGFATTWTAVFVSMSPETLGTLAEETKSRACSLLPLISRSLVTAMLLPLTAVSKLGWSVRDVCMALRWLCAWTQNIWATGHHAKTTLKRRSSDVTGGVTLPKSQYKTRNSRAQVFQSMLIRNEQKSKLCSWYCIIIFTWSCLQMNLLYYSSPRLSFSFIIEIWHTTGIEQTRA